jgi:hypothetical protein
MPAGRFLVTIAAILASAAMVSQVGADVRVKTYRLSAAPGTVIATGPGGNVIHYARLVSHLRKSGRGVTFAGACQSACTMFLAVPASRSCIMPGASFTFHRAYGSNQSFNRWATNFMMDRYPTWVRRWIAEHGGLSDQLLHMDYSYAARFIPPCHQRYSRVAGNAS